MVVFKTRIYSGIFYCVDLKFIHPENSFQDHLIQCFSFCFICTTCDFYEWDEYYSKFFEYAKNIELSPRGEYETNDVIQKYIDNNQASFTRLEYKWFDAGTYESLMQASNFVKEMSNSLAYQRHQNPLSRISSLRSFIKVSK